MANGSSSRLPYARVLARVFEDICGRPREILRVSAGLDEQPAALVIEIGMHQDRPVGGHRERGSAGYLREMELAYMDEGRTCERAEDEAG
jgi:hypothetical protein